MKVCIYITGNSSVTLHGPAARQFLDLVNARNGEFNGTNVVIKEKEEIRCVIYKKHITHFEVKGEEK